MRHHRRRRKLTQEQLAARADIDRRYLGKIETDDITDPGIETLIAIAKALDVHVSELADPRWYEDLDAQRTDWLVALRRDKRLDEDAKELVERIAMRLMAQRHVPADIGEEPPESGPQRAVGS